MSTKKIDALYLQGKEQADSFSFFHTYLRPFLWKYARQIGRQSLRQVEEHLIDEMVDDLLMDIGQFQGNSKFSTWAYVRFRRRWIQEHRYQGKNIGQSLETLQEAWEERQTEAADYFTDPYTKIEEPTQETGLILKEFAGRLTERQQSVLEMRRQGLTYREIGESLGISTPGAAKIWERVIELATEYGTPV